MSRPAQAETSDPYFEYGSESPDDEESATRRRVAWLAAWRRATRPRSPSLNRRGRRLLNFADAAESGFCVAGVVRDGADAGRRRLDRRIAGAGALGEKAVERARRGADDRHDLAHVREHAAQRVGRVVLR